MTVILDMFITKCLISTYLQLMLEIGKKKTLSTKIRCSLPFIAG